MRRSVLWGGLAVGALVGVVGVLWGWYGRGRATGRPDILLISIDTLRADRLGCYGYRGAHTPHMDRLAAGGVVFEAARSPVPITLPSHASMLTGLLPFRHGVRLNEGFRLPDAMRTLPEVLHESAYQTGGFIGGLPMARAGGLAQGFDVYDDQLSPRTLAESAAVVRQERYAGEVFAAARDWLRSTDPRRPVFAFIHVYDPHSPYEKPMPGATAPSYDGEVAYVDRAFGAFLSSLTGGVRWRNMLTVLTSDHGEGLGDHNEQTHGVFVYESTLRVPLVFHWPGVIAPRRVLQPVGITDVTPTILALARQPGLSDVDGTSLVPLLEHPEATGRTFHFESLLGSLKFGWAPLRGVRSGDLKYISAPKPELYDLSADPGERTNLCAVRPDDAARLARYLPALKEGAQATADVDQRTIDGLASLGYVSAPPVASDDPSEGPDPKDRIEVYEQYQLAHALTARGRFDEALKILASIESSFTNSPLYYYRWGNFAGRARRWRRAALCYEKCLALDPRHQDARLNLGVAYLKSNAHAKSLAQFETLLNMNPNHVEAHLYAGVVQAQHLGAPARAVPHWKRFLELAPNHREAQNIRNALAALPGS